MRHRHKNRIFGRQRAGRKALLSGLAVSLIKYEKIVTTKARAKEMRPYVEKLITALKKDSKDISKRREILRKIPQKGVVKKLVEEIAPRYKSRNGGYIRIIKLGQRGGDGAEMSQIEFV